MHIDRNPETLFHPRHSARIQSNPPAETGQHHHYQTQDGDSFGYSATPHPHYKPAPGHHGPGRHQGTFTGPGTHHVHGVRPPGRSDSSCPAINLGREYLGHNSINLKGRLANFTAVGGQTNNCAEFVSALLHNTGKLSGHHTGVGELEQSLIKQGYHRVSGAESKPGDVWMTPQRSHTELVSAPGGTWLLGSNNDRPGHQVISEKPHNPGSGVYYSRGEA